MNIIKKFGKYSRKEKAKYIISIGGMLITGGFAVYFVLKATSLQSYSYMAASYFSFIVMLAFTRIPIKSLFDKAK